MPSAKRNNIYISIGEWQYKKKYAIPYTGYVIGVGYAYVEYKTTTDEYNPNQSRAAYPFLGSAWYNGTASSQSRLFEHRIITEQHLDPSEDSIRESFPPVAPELQNAPRDSAKKRSILWAITNIVKATNIGEYERGNNNISSSATRFSSGRGFMQDVEWGGEATESNAFRHIMWQSYITSRYGVDVATDVGNAHEDDPNADTTQRHFRTRSEADQVIDLLNNQIGRDLGRRYPKGTPMNTIALRMLDEFYQNGFYTGRRTNEGTYYIDRTTLTLEDYEKIKVVLETLNELGRTEDEQTSRDEQVAKERLERMEATWGTMK